MKNQYTPLLKRIYDNASRTKDIKNLDAQEINWLNTIESYSQSQKGVYSVIITSLSTKIINPKQDVRKHQSKMNGGYSGRTVDTCFVTPFLKSVKFPAMKESGWLTRSLEQNQQYELTYRGAISNKEVKDAFLHLLDNIETKNKSPEQYLLYLFILSIKRKDKEKIKLITPARKDSKITINDIMSLLIPHFSYKYTGRGAARLPVLAIYSIYQCIMEEMKRYNGKELVPLGEHTSADLRSGAIGDIEVKNKDGTIYEALEIKHNIVISNDVVEYAYEKIKNHPITRFYILTTADPCIKQEDSRAIKSLIEHIREEHGCQVVINGVIPSIKYYLRLIKNIDIFFSFYTKNLEKDSFIKANHKLRWNELVEEWTKYG